MFHITTYDLDSVKNIEMRATTSKGNQRKWKVDDIWIKQDAFGYEGVAEFLATLILKCSTLPVEAYVHYQPCNIKIKNRIYKGCVSLDYRQGMYEKTLGRVLEENRINIEHLLKGKTTEEGLYILVDLIKRILGVDAEYYLRLLFTFDSLILNEDRHINNISFLYDGSKWFFTPIFDNGLSLLSDVRDYPTGNRPKTLMSGVKPRLFTRDFDEHSKLYKGEPFINRTKLMNYLNEYDEFLGRAGTVLRIQLNSGKFNHIFFN